jgi:hypothetical protein
VIAGTLLGHADSLADLAPGRARLDTGTDRDGELARDLLRTAPVLLQRRVDLASSASAPGGV